MSKVIDARGRSCPEPVIMTKNAIDSGSDKLIQVLVDAHVAVENITRFATSKGYKVDADEKDNEYVINIRK